jgi:hypothetical protein
MNAAIDALPTEELKIAARVYDEAPFPAYRQVPRWTPPISGFDRANYTNL